MTRLSDILPEVYPPLTLKLNAKQERFLRHIAQMAGTTPEEIATMLCATQLEFEASLMVDILASPAPDARPQQPDDLQAQEPPLTYGPGKLNLLSAEEIEEAAREHAEDTRQHFSRGSVTPSSQHPQTLGNPGTLGR